MATYGQNSTSADSFSLEIGDYTQGTENNYSKNNQSGSGYAAANQEFNFMHGTTTNGTEHFCHLRV